MNAAEQRPKSFIQKLKNIQRENNSLLCIGLDTDPAQVPAFLRGHDNPQLELNRRVIEATSDLVCAYKLNIAFYESTGEGGWGTVHGTLAAIPKAVVTIGDGKRGDIGNTAERQAQLLLDDWQFDGTTVNPYMGFDSVEPFARRREQCAFILALTSNPGANDFQYLKVGGKPLYERVVARVNAWNTKKNLGLVVGATHPKELGRIRKLSPGLPILIPGIGAQKGNLEQTIRFGCDTRGEMAIINIGRGILGAATGEDMADTVRGAALRYREEINLYREKYFIQKRKSGRSK